MECDNGRGGGEGVDRAWAGEGLWTNIGALCLSYRLYSFIYRASVSCICSTRRCRCPGPAIVHALLSKTVPSALPRPSLPLIWRMPSSLLVNTSRMHNSPGPSCNSPAPTPRRSPTAQTSTPLPTRFSTRFKKPKRHRPPGRLAGRVRSPTRCRALA